MPDRAGVNRDFTARRGAAFEVSVCLSYAFRQQFSYIDP